MDSFLFSLSRTRCPRDGSFGRLILAMELKPEGTRDFVAVGGRLSRDKFMSGAVLRRVGLGGGGGGSIADAFSDGEVTIDVAALTTVGTRGGGMSGVLSGGRFAIDVDVLAAAGTGGGYIAALGESAEARASRILDAGDPDIVGEGAVAPSESMVARVTLDLLVEADDVPDTVDSSIVVPLGTYEETVE